MSILSTNHLSRSYGQRRGIQDICLQVGQGEIFGFLGPNGAGKSTTIRVLLGFLKASSGSSEILGQDCWKDSASIKQDVGYVPGDVRLYPWLTARRGFQLVSEIRSQDLRAAGMQLAERFQLEPDLSVRKMSRGNRQKVALVLALVHRPQLIILDEPTSGLDPLMQDTLAACLRELAAQGHTIFFSSHTLSEVEALCDRAAIIRDGRIVSDQTLAAMKSQAPRSVTLTFADEQSAAGTVLPEFVKLQRRSGSTVNLLLKQNSVDFIRWAAEQPLVDVSIGLPNLESLFRGFYTEDLDSSVTTASSAFANPDAESVSSFAQ